MPERYNVFISVLFSIIIKYSSSESRKQPFSHLFLQTEKIIIGFFTFYVHGWTPLGHTGIWIPQPAVLLRARGFLFLSSRMFQELNNQWTHDFLTLMCTMQICCKVNYKENILHFTQKFMARCVNIELKILYLVLLWPGPKHDVYLTLCLKWFRTLDYSYFLLSTRGTLGRCLRNPWVLRNPGWKSLGYQLWW